MENSNYLKSFLLIYLVSLSGFTTTLVNNKLKQKIAENRFAQHLVGVITVLVLVNLLGVDRLDKLIPSSIFIYLGFILTTKLSLNINIIMLLLFLIGYIFEIKFNRKIKILKEDQFINQNMINKKIIEQNKIRFVFGFILITTVVYGCVDNYTKKELELEGGFNPIRFFMDGTNNMNGGGLINYKI